MRTLISILITIGIGVLCPIAAMADDTPKTPEYRIPKDVPPEMIPLITGQVHDTVFITKISGPDLVEGVPTDMTVEVTYKLESRDEAALVIGFNELNSGGPNIKTRVPITKGNGVRTAQVSVNPRIWSKLTSFQAFASILCLTNDKLSHWISAQDSKELAVAPGQVNKENMASNAKPSETFSDGVSIVSITPDCIKPGEQATVTVRVQYELFTCDQGEINLGINEGSGNGYRIVAQKVVGIGNGEVTITAPVTATKTGDMPLMKVFVNMSELRWTPNVRQGGRVG
jgi:hypothetical protein